MSWIHPLAGEDETAAEVIGGKAHGLAVLRRLGLPVPPGFVIGTGACRAFRRDGRFPDGLAGELAAAVRDLEAATGRRLGTGDRPLAVAVRSGGSVSMPGMMNTILNLGLTTEATAALAVETGDRRFALDSRLRFLSSFAAAVHGLAPENLAAEQREPKAEEREADTEEDRLAAAIRDVEEFLRNRGGDLPDDATRQLELAVGAVFAS